MVFTGTNLPNMFLDTNHLLGDELIDGTFLAKCRDESACVHDNPAQHMAHLNHNNAMERNNITSIKD
jgi:hypothetical protein